MAVLAGHVAHIPHIDLKDFDSGRLERKEVDLLQLLLEPGKRADFVVVIVDHIQLDGWVGK
jgi:hypothetical protein